MSIEPFPCASSSHQLCTHCITCRQVALFFHRVSTEFGIAPQNSNKTEKTRGSGGIWWKKAVSNTLQHTSDTKQDCCLFLTSYGKKNIDTGVRSYIKIKIMSSCFKSYLDYKC